MPISPREPASTMVKYGRFRNSGQRHPRRVTAAAAATRQVPGDGNPGPAHRAATGYTRALPRWATRGAAPLTARRRRDSRRAIETSTPKASLAPNRVFLWTALENCRTRLLYSSPPSAGAGEVCGAPAVIKTAASASASKRFLRRSVAGLGRHKSGWAVAVGPASCGGYGGRLVLPRIPICGGTARMMGAVRRPTTCLGDWTHGPHGEIPTVLAPKMSVISGKSSRVEVGVRVEQLCS